MLLNSTEKEKLYAKSVPVSIRDACSTRSTNLFFTIEWQDTPDGTYNRKVLVLSLTDDNDPFFLYNLHLSDEDFQVLKANQELLINFPSFPQHIIDYIEKCVYEQKNPQPRFLLIFTVNDNFGGVASPSRLDIVETNQFKNLTHLSLKFIAAPECTVRQYLITCFRNLKEERAQLQHKLCCVEQDLKDRLASCQHALSNKAEELKTVRKQTEDELSLRDNKHALELKEQRDRLLQQQREELTRSEKEIREKEHNFHRKIQQLEDNVSYLDSVNKDLQGKNDMQESTVSDLRSQVHSLQIELKQLKESSHSYKQKYDRIHSEMKERQSHIHHQDQKIRELEQEVRNKDQSTAKVKRDLEDISIQKKALEVELENVKLQVQFSETSRKIYEDEKLRSNEIILKLQQKVKATVDKMKSKVDLCAKQEQKIQEMDILLGKLNKENSDMAHYLEAKKAEVKSLKESISSLENKVDCLEKEIKDNKNVIRYLSHELSDRRLAKEIPENLEHSPSSVAQKKLEEIQCGRKSTSPNISPVVNTSSKPVRKGTSSSNKKAGHTPSHFQATGNTDSAYCTSPSGYTHQTTPEGQFRADMNLSRTELDADPAAWSATFGNGTIKHSTAKKQTNIVKSTIPKYANRR